jgi:predicted acylesterase/phospholipase RssA
MSHSNSGFKIVSLEASGFDGLERILGSIWYLQTLELFNNVSIYAASSASSYIAIMIIMGYSVVDIVQDFVQIKVLSQLCPFRDGILSNLNLNNVRTQLKQRITDKYGKQLTFTQLLEYTGKRFVTIAMDEKTNTVQYLYDHTCPQMDIVDAVVASCSTSGIFPAFHYGGKSYIDAGSVKPLILEPFIGQDSEILCICVDQYISPIVKGNIIEMSSYQLKAYFVNLHQYSRTETITLAIAGGTNINVIRIPAITSTCEKDETHVAELHSSKLIALGWKTAEIMFPGIGTNETTSDTGNIQHANAEDQD